MEPKPVEYGFQVLEVCAPWGWAKHLKIWRHDGKSIRADWDVIQEIKNEALGSDVLAVEFFPPDRLVVNEINFRHLWTMDVQPPLRVNGAHNDD